jgi:hypothetical protein
MKTFLNRLKTIWLSFAQKLGRVNTIVLLTLVYVVVVGFMAIIAKILRKDPLQKKIDPKRTSYWCDRTSSEQTLEHQRFQF